MEKRTLETLENVALHNVNNDRLALGARAVGVLGAANGGDILLALASVARGDLSHLMALPAEQRVDSLVSLVVDVVHELSTAPKM